jgi:hypothetical protein
MRYFPLLLLILGSLAACDSGNIEPISSYNAPKAPPVRNSTYNPYAAYGEANATWEPPTYNRDGTIMKPAEPASQSDRPAFESAPWATGAGGGSASAPFGTF